MDGRLDPADLEGLSAEAQRRFFREHPWSDRRKRNPGRDPRRVIAKAFDLPLRLLERRGREPYQPLRPNG